MLIRFFHTPALVQKAFQNIEWRIATEQKTVFLTFDDGPRPELTPWVLDLLSQRNAKATFFCVGQNIQRFKGLYQDILDQGHSVGNHTFNHLNGWQQDTKEYIENVQLCSEHCSSNLFRPPYGRLKPSQLRALRSLGFRVINWTYLSYDFDGQLDVKKALNEFERALSPGLIAVFHDQPKSISQLKRLLPAVLDITEQQGFKSVPL